MRQVLGELPGFVINRRFLAMYLVLCGPASPPKHPPVIGRVKTTRARASGEGVAKDAKTQVRSLAALGQAGVATTSAAREGPAGPEGGVPL